jgi:hypothetical protein
MWETSYYLDNIGINKKSLQIFENFVVLLKILPKFAEHTKEQ